jgi:glycosyltransferase involved in cell wall biosynthesis
MSKPRPKISIVLPTYNRRSILSRAIASVLAQNESDFELIVVDDCSTDDTRAYLSSLTEPRIRVLGSPRNVGPAGARNVGLKAACADIVAFLDSDDVYLPKRPESTIAAFANDREVVATLSSSVRHDPNGVRMAGLPELTLASRPFEWALFSEPVGVDGTGIAVRRPVALEIGGFCEALQCI